MTFSKDLILIDSLKKELIESSSFTENLMTFYYKNKYMTGETLHELMVWEREKLASSEKLPRNHSERLKITNETWIYDFEFMQFTWLETLQQDLFITHISPEILKHILDRSRSVDCDYSRQDYINHYLKEIFSCFEHPLEQIKAKDPEKFKSYLIEQNLMDPEVEYPRDPNLDVLVQEKYVTQNKGDQTAIKSYGYER